MGNFREKNHEGVKEMQENSRETSEIGSEMTEQALEINAILESIDLQDNEDVQAISETGRSYQSSFDGAFSEQVETSGQEIQSQGEQISDTVNTELKNVQNGIGKLEQAGGISEIGQGAADTGSSKLEGSAEEYEQILSYAKSIAKETQQHVEEMKNNLSKIFG